MGININVNCSTNESKWSMTAKGNNVIYSKCIIQQINDCNTVIYAGNDPELGLTMA